MSPTVHISYDRNNPVGLLIHVGLRNACDPQSTKCPPATFPLGPNLTGCERFDRVQWQVTSPVKTSDAVSQSPVGVLRVSVKLTF